MISTSRTSDFRISGSAISSHKNIHTDESAPDHGLYALLAEELENCAVSRPKTPGYNEWSDVVDAAIEDIRNGADVKSTLDAAASRIDGILQKYTR